jgi:hypothetical protein
MHACAGPDGSKCYGFDTLADGSMLLACSTCVYSLSPDGTPTGRNFCPGGAGLALQHVAVHPSNNFFFVADANSNLLYKVSLQNWGASTKFTVPRVNRVNGLFKLGSIDDAAFQGARKGAEQDWVDNVSGLGFPHTMNEDNAWVHWGPNSCLGQGLSFRGELMPC